MTIDEARDVVGRCRFAGWQIGVFDDFGGGNYLQVSDESPCAETGKDILWSGRKWRLSRHMTKSELVQTALTAVLAAVEHEARERFTYRGRPIFGPHFDVDRLVELCESNKATEART